MLFSVRGNAGVASGAFIPFCKYNSMLSFMDVGKPKSLYSIRLKMSNPGTFVGKN